MSVELRLLSTERDHKRREQNSRYGYNGQPLNSVQSEFQSFAFGHGLSADLAGDKFPTRLATWSGGEISLGEGATHFGYVFEGAARLACALGEFAVAPGFYFSAPGAGRISGAWRGLVISRIGHSGFLQTGGPLEEKGRLRYIDGCTDSLLIPPILKGDPCLNLLHIPAGTRQTRHTHSSLRAGIILSGEGRCVTRQGAFPLRPGLIFLIPADCIHSFHTGETALRVLAFHPDSDFGPTHEDHPMVNRTIVEGLPVRQRRELLTFAEAAQ